MIQKYFIVLIFLFFGCNTNKNQNDKASFSNEPIRNLEFGFTLKGIDTDIYKKYGVLTKLRLLKNNKTIYEYDNIDEFYLDSIQAYVFRHDNGNCFDVLIEGPTSPNKNELNQIRICNDSLISTFKIPTFESLPKNLDEDENLEVAGVWSWFEFFGENADSTSYNPILYFEISKNGLNLDTLLTVSKNVEIYGDFYGYKYSEKQSQPSSILKKFDLEIERINK